MSEVATQSPTPPTVSKRKPPASGEETLELIKRATAGDQSCLPEVRALLADPDSGPDLRTICGSSAHWLRQSIIRKAAGKDVLRREAIKQELERVGSELEGPNPTPMERLLAERASLCWFIVQWYEDAYVNRDGWSITLGDYQHRIIDKAHRRFLTAVRTLAQVRKLALPALQVNIARNQINVAETGSSAS